MYILYRHVIYFQSRSSNLLRINERQLDNFLYFYIEGNVIKKHQFFPKIKILTLHCNALQAWNVISSFFVCEFEGLISSKIILTLWTYQITHNISIHCCIKWPQNLQVKTLLQTYNGITCRIYNKMLCWSNWPLRGNLLLILKKFCAIKSISCNLNRTFI